MSCPGSEASVLEGWVDVDKERGYVSVHTTDGKVCHAVGDYPKGMALSLIREEARRHPEGVTVFVEDGFRFFPMEKVSHIAFRRTFLYTEDLVCDAPGD